MNMTLTDQIKLFDRKIKQNEAQYDLDRKVAKISALSSGNLDKYEYLTDEDLKVKPGPFEIEKAKFEASSLGMAFDVPKKDGTANTAKNESDFNYDSNHKFYIF